MPVRRHPHSIRFSQDEWDAIRNAAAQNKMAPGEFVREASVRATYEAMTQNDAQLTPELIELIKTTFRGVHVLAYLKREQLHLAGEQEGFSRAVSAAQAAQLETLSASDSA